MRNHPLLAVVLCAALLSLPVLAGCGDAPPPSPRPSAAASGTLGPMPRDAIHAGARAMGHGHGAPERASRLTWTRPDAWEDLPPAPMRAAGFSVRGQADTECTLVLLAGSGGGLVANVNRWRVQMGLEPLSAEAVDALPRRLVLGAEAAYVEMAGPYQGMGKGAVVPDALLLGLILERAQDTVFVKMVGPSAVIEGQRASFEAFADSLAEAAAPARAPATAPSLTWTAPSGWQQQPARALRQVTFAPGGSAKTQCYVTILPGQAGGLEANINLWREQVGQKALSAEEIGALETVPMLGGEATLVVVRGDFQGASGTVLADTMMAVLVRSREQDTVFVKLIGPAAEVEPELESFIAFGKSLTE